MNRSLDLKTALFQKEGFVAVAESSKLPVTMTCPLSEPEPPIRNKYKMKIH